MLQYESKNRPNIDEILTHEWFEGEELSHGEFLTQIKSRLSQARESK